MKKEAILRWGSYDIENCEKMLTSFYIDPLVKNISNGDESRGKDVADLIMKIKKGNVILVTGSAGSGKSTFLKKCFISNFRRRKKNVIAFWMSASLINERKPRKEYDFFRNIRKSYCTSKNKVIIFIDSVDEIFNNENKNIIQYITDLINQKMCVVLGCRKDYYNRFLIDYEFTNVYEIKEWNKEQIEEYIISFLTSRGKQYLFEKIINHNNTLKQFLVNPFQITLLMSLVGSDKEDKIDQISNVYSLYNTFYDEWIFKEIKRNSSIIEEKDIKDIHYRIAKAFYKNFNRAVSIKSVLTKRQKALEFYKDASVLSLLKLREEGMVEKYIAEGFLHESFSEFLTAKNLIDSLLSGGVKIFNCFLLTHRHFTLDFLEEGFSDLSMSDVRKIKNNLERAYISLMPESSFAKANIDQSIQKKCLHVSKQQIEIVRDQCIFYLGKLPEKFIKDSEIFELAYSYDDCILSKISAATVIVNHNFNFSIEKEYVMNLLNNELWEKTLRSWVLVFWGDVIYDEPYTYVDRGGSWDRIKKRRLSRIQLENTEQNKKYMNTRAVDLAQLYIFFRNRGWNTMTREEYDIIYNCDCDLDIYSDEKKELLRYLKSCFKTAWENKLKESL